MTLNVNKGPVTVGLCVTWRVNFLQVLRKRVDWQGNEHQQTFQVLVSIILMNSIHGEHFFTD
jgi:hypothetical protein